MSVTFSSEVQQFCRDLGSPTYIVSRAKSPGLINDGNFVVEQRPSVRAKGWRYHINEVLYGVGLLKTAVVFKSDYAIIESGSAPFFIFLLFRLFGIKIIAVLHNTLWPSGYPPRSLFARAILASDAAFFRLCATAAICVSPECSRQIRKITRDRCCKILEISAQFSPKLFEARAAPDDLYPFRVIFAGRITKEKGVFDLLDIMRLLNRQRPGDVLLQICGDGPDLEALRDQCSSDGLLDVVSIRGMVSPVELRKILAESHLSIVPTRSEFSEGMAMSAIEPVLIGRPVLTSRVVPAHEILKGACALAETDNVESYARKILELIDRPDRYAKLCESSRSVRDAFFDRSRSYHAALLAIIPPAE